MGKMKTVGESRQLDVAKIGDEELAQLKTSSAVKSKVDFPGFSIQHRIIDEVPFYAIEGPMSENALLYPFEHQFVFAYFISNT